MDGDGGTVSATLYRTFWGLQAAFREPYAALEPGRWAVVVADLRTVLAEFAAKPTSVGRAGPCDGDTQLGALVCLAHAAHALEGGECCCTGSCLPAGQWPATL